MADARRDFCHQLSTALIRENQAVAVENLAVKGLARTRMAKSVHDGLVRVRGDAGVQGHAARPGIPPDRPVRADLADVLGCGVKDGPKPLHVREWQCGACGARLDRDVNAAVNVAKAAGLAVRACGAQVRPGLALAQRGEAGTHPTSRHKAA